METAVGAFEAGLRLVADTTTKNIRHTIDKPRRLCGAVAVSMAAAGLVHIRHSELVKFMLRTVWTIVVCNLYGCFGSDLRGQIEFSVFYWLIKGAS